MVKGIIRHVDDLGRVVIPKEIRRALRIKEGDALNILVEGNGIRMRRAEKSCISCGTESEERLREHDGMYMCGECLKNFT